MCSVQRMRQNGRRRGRVGESDSLNKIVEVCSVFGLLRPPSMIFGVQNHRVYSSDWLATTGRLLEGRIENPNFRFENLVDICSLYVLENRMVSV
ncbi:hypothetical protein OROHE_012966 [Orobanche hederae]